MLSIHTSAQCPEGGQKARVLLQCLSAMCMDGSCTWNYIIARLYMLGGVELAVGTEHVACAAGRGDGKLDGQGVGVPKDTARPASLGTGGVRLASTAAIIN